MNYYSQLRNKLTTRRTKHLNYVLDDIYKMRYSILSLTVQYGYKKIEKEIFHEILENRVALLVKREKYRKQLQRWH
jgi:hypothetical protein